MNAFKYKILKDQLGSKFDILNAFSFKCDAFSLNFYHTVFILHRGVVIQASYIFYEDSKSNFKDAVKSLENELIYQIDKVDHLLFNPLEKTRNSRKPLDIIELTNEFDSLISELQFPLVITKFVEPQNTIFQIKGDIMEIFKTFKDNKHNNLFCYNKVLEATIMSSDKLISFLKSDPKIPASVRIN